MKQQVRVWICEGCSVIFQVHPKVKRNKPFCPSCGELIDVHRYNASRTNPEGRNIKIRWKPEEIELLERCLRGELQPYQVAIQIGRSPMSVTKKLARMKKIARG